MTREEALEIVKASFGWTSPMFVASDEIPMTQRETILRAHRIINNDIDSPTTDEASRMSEQRAPWPDNFLATKTVTR